MFQKVVLAVLLIGLFAGSAEAGRLITGKQVKDGSLSGRDIRNFTLGGNDLGVGIVGMEHLDEAVADMVERSGPPGPAGAAGPQGTPGTHGPAGPIGVANITIAQGNATICGGTQECSVGLVESACPVGMKAVGGGYVTSSGVAFGAGIAYNAQTGRGGYLVGVDNYGATSFAEASAFAYCSPDIASVKFPNGTEWKMSAEAKKDMVQKRYESHR